MSQDSQEENAEVIFILSVVCTGTLCIFGLIGNVVSLVALCRETRKTSNVHLLSALCVADWFMLVVIFHGETVVKFCTYLGEVDTYMKSVGAPVIRAVWMLGCIIQTCDIWLVVAVTWDRFVAVHWPMRRRTSDHSARAKQLIAAVVAFAILVNVPRFFHYMQLESRKYKPLCTQRSENASRLNDRNETYLFKNYQLNNTDIVNVSESTVRNSLDIGEMKVIGLTECGNGTWTPAVELRHSVWYHYIYYIVIQWLVLYILPFIVLLLLNVLLSQQIKQAHGNHARLTATNSNKDNDVSVTVNIVAVVTVFMICQTPDFVHTLISYPAFGVSRTTQKYTSSTAYGFLALNSSVNFIIYCLFYKRFRRTVLRMFCRWNSKMKGSILMDASTASVACIPKKNSLKSARVNDETIDIEV